MEMERWKEIVSVVILEASCLVLWKNSKTMVQTVVVLVVVILADVLVCVELTRNEILDLMVVVQKEQWQKRKRRKEKIVEA